MHRAVNNYKLSQKNLSTPGGVAKWFKNSYTAKMLKIYCDFGNKTMANFIRDKQKTQQRYRWYSAERIKMRWFQIF
jgi:glucose dehydrogenase